MSFFEDFKKPINIIFLILAIGGIIFGYYNGRKTKSLSYNISDQPTLIYDSRNASSAIKVIAKDNSYVDKDLYLLTGVIWNSGDLPISHEDIRQKLSLNLPNCQKILDFKISRQTDPNVAQFQLTKVGDKTLDVSWKYFDPGYGFKFQVIYIGNQDSKFNLTGKILDIATFNLAKPPLRIDFPVYITIVTVALTFVLFLITVKRRQYVKSGGDMIFWYCCLIFIVAGILFLTSLLLHGMSSPMPFS